MNSVDYGIAGIVLLSLWIGGVRGFVKEAIALLSWASGIWAGLSFSPELAFLLPDVVKPLAVRIVVTYLLIVMASLILGGLLNHFLGYLPKQNFLLSLNRMAGMLLGTGRGIIIVAIAVLLVGLSPLAEQASWKESVTIPAFQMLISWLRERLLLQV